MLTAIVVLLSLILFFQLLFGLAQSGSMKTLTETVQKVVEAVEANNIDKLLGKRN